MLSLSVMGAQFFLDLTSSLSVYPSALSSPQNCLALTSFLLGRVSTWWPPAALGIHPPSSSREWVIGMIWIRIPSTVASRWGVWLVHVCIHGDQEWGISSLSNVDWQWEGGRSIKADQIDIGRPKSPVSTWGLVNNPQLGRWMTSHTENLSVTCWTERLAWDTVLTPARQRETVFPVFLI